MPLPTFEARVEHSDTFGPRCVSVSEAFASRLRTEHSRTFELSAEKTSHGDEAFGRDLPNVGGDDVAHLGPEGIVECGTEVSPGMLLVGRVSPRFGLLASPEEKLLRAIFGEQTGSLRDTSMRVPPGCFGTVTEARVEPGDGKETVAQATVVVTWERPLAVGDVLELDGAPVTVAAIVPGAADIARHGGAGEASVAKVGMVLDTVHARSIGPYSTVSQQPLRTREEFGGQALTAEQAEVLAEHAPWAAWELLTLHADAVVGRARMYESLVRGGWPATDGARVPRPPTPKPRAEGDPSSGGTRDIFSFFERPAGPGPGEVTALQPESTTVWVAHLWAMALDVDLRQQSPRATLRTDAQILEGSHGEITKPETINYSTMVPEPGGLFCAQVFGPTADYECQCGKYKRMKHRGHVCEDCGVEVIHSQVRRERFGHVVLPMPCLHPLFAEATATLLDVPLEDLRGALGGEKALTGEGLRWEVTDGENPRHGEAVWDALAQLDLEEIEAIESGTRADIAASLLETQTPATALMLRTVPVLSPDLRPLVPLSGGRFATSDHNDLYRRLINRSNRVKRLRALDAPAAIFVKESQMLQQALDQLFVNERADRPAKGPNDRPLRSLQSSADATFARITSKAVDYSGVSHLVEDPELEPGECRIPRSMLVELFKPRAVSILEQRGFTTTIKAAKRLLERETDEGLAAIEAASEGYPVLLMAGDRVIGRRVRAWHAPAIGLDRDGVEQLASTTVRVHVPWSREAAMQIAGLVDAPHRSGRTYEGWFSETRGGGSITDAAVRSILGGLSDDIDDPLLWVALGRTPTALDEAETEAWGKREDARRARLADTLFTPAEQQRREQPPETLQRPLTELELSVRSANALAQAGLVTLADLCQRTEAELLKTKGFDRKSLKEIKEILAQLGLSLGMRL